MPPLPRPDRRPLLGGPCPSTPNALLCRCEKTMQTRKLPENATESQELASPSPPDSQQSPRRDQRCPRDGARRPLTGHPEAPWRLCPRHLPQRWLHHVQIQGTDSGALSLASTESPQNHLPRSLHRGSSQPPGDVAGASPAPRPEASTLQPRRKHRRMGRPRRGTTGPASTTRRSGDRFPWTNHTLLQVANLSIFQK